MKMTETLRTSSLSISRHLSSTFDCVISGYSPIYFYIIRYIKIYKVWCSLWKQRKLEAFYDITHDWASANVPSESEMNDVCLSTFSFPAYRLPTDRRKERTPFRLCWPLIFWLVAHALFKARQRALKSLEKLSAVGANERRDGTLSLS